MGPWLEIARLSFKLGNIRLKAIVFQTREYKAESAKDWLRGFQSQLGKHWVGLPGSETALELLHLLVAPLEEDTFQSFVAKLRGHSTIPSAYDPNTVKNLALLIHPFYSTQGNKERGHEYRKGPTPKHCSLVVGIDDVEFERGLAGEESKDAKKFFQTLFHQCKPRGVVLVLGTHVTAIAEEMLQLGGDQRLCLPMITSIIPDPNDADVYNDYAKLAEYRDDGGKYKLDEYLRLVRPDGDKSRIKSLLEMIYEIKTAGDNENLAQALYEDSLEASLQFLENAYVSPSTSPQHEKVNQRYSLQRHRKGPTTPTSFIRVYPKSPAMRLSLRRMRS
jgi:hypothetical protein